MAQTWNPRQTVLAVVVAGIIGIVGGGAVYAATDVAGQRGGPDGGFGPPGPPPSSQIR